MYEEGSIIIEAVAFAVNATIAAAGDMIASSMASGKTDAAITDAAADLAVVMSNEKIIGDETATRWLWSWRSRSMRLSRTDAQSIQQSTLTLRQTLLASSKLPLTASSLSTNYKH